MKKYIFSIAMMLASLAAVAQHNPCEFPITSAGQSGVAVIDSAVFGDLTPRCTPCPTEGCVGFQIDSPDSCFHIGVYPTHASTVTVQIVTECNWLLWDTCATILGGSISPPEMLFFGITIPANSQILVCGAIGDTFGIEIKSLNPPTYPYYGTPIANLDTSSSAPTGRARRGSPSRWAWKPKPAIR